MNTELLTLAEHSNFCRTGRIDEVERLCDAYAKRWPDALRSFEYGRSAEGRPLRALIVSRAGSLSSADLKRRKVPVLMIQAGIHPGESDGKDAGFIALRELLEGNVLPGVLEKISVLFVPAFNTDGHERVGRWNRPNQNGPEETGWRTTAQNINLNRDHMKARTPEMQAMLRLVNEWDPLVQADLHVTDGADFEPDISIQVEPINQGDPQLRSSGLQLRDELLAKLTGQGSLPLSFYPDLATTDDPTSGFILTVYSPRFSTGYFPQRNRFTVLVETHSWKPYARRVRAMRDTIIDLAELTGTHGMTWLEHAYQADVAATRVGGTALVLDYSAGWREPTKAGDAASVPAMDAEIIEFRGYAYTRKPSPISGDLVTVYDPKTPQIWTVPLRNRVQAALTVTAPRGGYIVPACHAREIGENLTLHGIAFERVSALRPKMSLALFRATRVQFSTTPFEGCMRATLEGSWREEINDVGDGALFVPIAQPLSRLVVALLEPQAPDSFAAWGFFNACFEQKEQMEPYVAEQIAREMLAADPTLATEFKRMLATDAAFAATPAARLEFFLRRHSSWDERFNLYPVMRTESVLQS